MGKIIVLDENTSNKIAAGEVVERPASVVKELLENSIDAGATNISIEIKNGGITFIKISDNGSGIDEDDVELAFERHATSKIKNANDLEAIGTLGFRGEALASIASVSSVELTSRIKEKTHGTHIHIRGGVIKEVNKTGCPVGTTILVKDLFYNTPARFKFLKKDTTEAGYITDIISRVALSKPHIAFKLISNHSIILQTPGNNDLQSVVYSIYGKEAAKNSLEINYSDIKVNIRGFAGKSEISRSNRTHQSIFVNGRYIKSKVITSAIDEAYKTYLLKNKFAFIVLALEINPILIDVNVHPTKMEIRFSDEQEIFRSVFHAITNALTGKDLIKNIVPDVSQKNPFKFNNEHIKTVTYEQQKVIQNAVPVRELVQQETSPLQAEEAKKETIETKQIVKKNELNEFEEKLVNSFSEKETTENPTSQTIEIKSEEKRNLLDFSQAMVVGQAFSTYILLQMDQNLILIDQHAAHERIRYEYYRNKFLNQESLSQELLAPMVVELTQQEIKFLLDEQDFFEKLGFKYEGFGNNSIILRAVPMESESISIKNAFIEVVDSIISKGKQDYKKYTDEMIYTIACKSAVKANKKMDEREIRSLLEELSTIDNPYTCPHGRPTIIKLSQYELEKMFKRII